MSRVLPKLLVLLSVFMAASCAPSAMFTGKYTGGIHRGKYWRTTCARSARYPDEPAVLSGNYEFATERFRYGPWKHASGEAVGSRKQRVTLNSEPPHARVYKGNELLGTTPLPIDLSYTVDQRVEERAKY